MLKLDSYEEEESLSLNDTTTDKPQIMKAPLKQTKRIRKRKPCHVETKNLCKFFGSRLYLFLM